MTDIRDVAPIGRTTTLRGCRVECAFAQAPDGTAVRIFTPTGTLDLEVSWEEFVPGCWRPVVKVVPPAFLTVTVSEDTKVIGIDHPTDANWEDVRAAHIALRDHINARLEEQDRCPHKPS